MASLADKAILSGADNRPPMLEKDMYDSWKSRMELYMLNHPHGRMILELVEQGPLIWTSVEVEGVTRLKKYSELSVAEAIQADCDVKATNIILQGLPPEKFTGTVRFGNDHVAAILGFGDLQWGNILITRVYFIEGLGHNLFLVGQFCADNRPSMLEKDMYDSWKSRMELYMLNRVIRLKKYSELSAAEAIQANCDVKATNIILQSKTVSLI
nr:integrase, catalytic region, zinc finger, CCHC-type, peptidase aspartic, catalytic [Tanacetum cinerariifolium]